MCLSASLTWEIFTPRHLLLPLAFITFITVWPAKYFWSTYISTYIHASIRMDVANHTVDAYSSYGGGEASFIHEVLFTPLNLESPCVAFLFHQQNKTLLKDRNVLTSVCHALLLLLPLLFWGIHWCALRNLIYVDYFVWGLFWWLHFVRTTCILIQCHGICHDMKILNCALRSSHSSILHYNSGLNMVESNSLLQT